MILHRSTAVYVQGDQSSPRDRYIHTTYRYSSTTVPCNEPNSDGCDDDTLTLTCSHAPSSRMGHAMGVKGNSTTLSLSLQYHYHTVITITLLIFIFLYNIYYIINTATQQRQHLKSSQSSCTATMCVQKAEGRRYHTVVYVYHTSYSPTPVPLTEAR